MNLKLKKIIYSLGVILVFLIVLAVLNLRGSFIGQKLRLTVCDVGQGDAILIQTPSGQDILIDGGPDLKVLDCLGRHLGFDDKELDLVILTHPHSDHVAGLVEVLRRYQVKKVLLTGVKFYDPGYEEFMKIISAKNIPQITAQAGENFEFGSELSLKIVYPLISLENKEVKNLNDSSIVGRLVYKQNSFLLTGDLDSDGEAALLASGQDLSAQVLKVGHHGSVYSSSLEFLEAVKASWAAISVGKDNKFGHPSSRIVYRLERAGAQVFRTDEHGDVEFVSDGEGVEVK